MAIDSLAMKIGAVPGSLPKAAEPTSTAGAGFAQALAAISSPTPGGAGTPGHPVREVQGAALKGGSGPGLGQQILNNLETLYRGDLGMKRSASVALPAARPAVASPAAVLPGPAAAPLSGASSPKAETGAAPTSQPDPHDFGTMMRSLEQVYTHAIQVSVVTKTTGSFTSSMNKLMSSA
jgi:hypothetical protein